MPLPPGSLDARDFQQIVDQTKRRIPYHCPEWTNHNLSDPGVALIELFAWMTESILYRLDQVPERYYEKFLELVGVEPFGPSVASTELTFWLSTILSTPVRVPTGTAVATTPLTDARPVVFTTVEDLVVSPPQLIGAKTSRAQSAEQFIDVWAPKGLMYGDLIKCFPSDFAPDAIPVGDALYLAFEESLADSLIHLAIESPTSGHGVDPKDPPLGWQVWSGEAWIDVELHGDSTGGLNKPGDVLLKIPSQHGQRNLGGLSAYWLRVRLGRAEKGQDTYEESPQISSIVASCVGGTVRAEHAEIIGSESLGRSDGSPGQSFVVSRPPVLKRRDGERIQVIGIDDVENDWVEVDDFTASTEDDKHYTWDDATGVVRFGPRVRYADAKVKPRQHGAIPRDGAEIVVTGYRSGGGTRGNMGAELLTSLRDAPVHVDRVTNLVPAIGGVDPETIDEVKVRGPISIRTGSRAVTARDFERIAKEASAEVKRARCLSPAGPGKPIRLLLVPDVKTEPEAHTIDDFALDAQLVSTVHRELDKRRLIGSSVEVGTPYYQGVSVAALLHALPGRREVVTRLALELLYGYINPVTGGDDGLGWQFDRDISAASIAKMLEGIDGVERVDKVLLYEYDLRERERFGPARDVIRLQTDALFLSPDSSRHGEHQVVVR